MKSWISPAGEMGGFASLRMVDRPVPEPGPGEVRVKVHARSTNFRDLSIAAGKYLHGPVQRDTIPLSDGAGQIVTVGEGVTAWKPGDRVAGTFFQNWRSGPLRPDVFGSDLGGPIDGMLAEEVVLSEQGIVRIPDRLSFEEAACLPCAAVTAWNALFETGDLGPGDVVLVLGTGGVSTIALQLAKMVGATVVVTSSSHEKLARARRLGADHLINYRDDPEWSKTVLAVTGGRGADIVIEVGGPGTLPQSLASVATGGLVALIGVLAGSVGEINPMALLRKAARLQGVFVGSRAMFETMNRAIAANCFAPIIDRVVAFEDAPQAYAHQKSGEHFGKIVIVSR